jgi:flavodoxin
MKNIILYSSKSGNTAKVASSISSELGAIQFNVRDLTDKQKKDFWKNNQADIYWIGSGVYGGRFEKKIRKFLDQYLPPDDANLALFATWLGRGDSANKAFQKLEDQLLNRSQQLNILIPHFFCYGKTLCLKRKHPSSVDRKNAREWAKKLQEKMMK